MSVSDLSVGKVASPWRLLPLHIIAHMMVFIGTLVSVIWPPVTEHAVVVGGPLSGMELWEFVLWAAMGLSTVPIILGSYLLAAYFTGYLRYLALWLHMLGNLVGVISVGVYTYATIVSGISYPHGWGYAWAIYTCLPAYLVWLLGNDIIRMRQYERLASAMERADNARAR